MIAESQIREKLGQYLSKQLSLDQFEDWLAEHSWNMHKDSSESAQKLASAIELRLAEHSSGHLDECALRDELRPLVTNIIMQISFGGAPVVTQEPPNNVNAKATARVITFPSRWDRSPEPSIVVDTERAVELVSG
jgi:hypothetical protein